MALSRIGKYSFGMNEITMINLKKNQFQPKAQKIMKKKIPRNLYKNEFKVVLPYKKKESTNLNSSDVHTTSTNSSIHEH